MNKQVGTYAAGTTSMRFPRPMLPRIGQIVK